MAHPPDVDSDLTYEQWITSIMDAPQRGMKLDFKNVDAVDPALAMLQGRMLKTIVKYYKVYMNLILFSNEHLSIPSFSDCVT